MTEITDAMRARRGPLTAEILQLRVELAVVSPPVTRTIQIRATSQLTTLHRAIQFAMGWQNYHLYEFSKDGVLYAEENPFAMVGDPEPKTLRTKVGTLLPEDGDTARYLYDFGDSWEHTVTREAELPADLQFRRPRCIAGENACPPEDVGGPPGYMNFLEAMLDPGHEEHEDMMMWFGRPFDPKQFSVEEADERMRRELGR